MPAVVDDMRNVLREYHKVRKADLSLKQPDRISPALLSTFAAWRETMLIAYVRCQTTEFVSRSGQEKSRQPHEKIEEIVKRGKECQDWIPKQRTMTCKLDDRDSARWAIAQRIFVRDCIGAGA